MPAADLVFGQTSMGSAATGALADKVLGEPDFTTVNEARVVSQKDFPYPYGVCSDGTTLWVAEGYGHRVLRFDNAASKLNYANADGVLGAADYTAQSASASASTFSFPDATAIDGSGTLYVGDSNNHRVMIFKNASAKANGAAADYVLGATALSVAGYSTPTTASSVSGVSGMAIDNLTGKLFVSTSFDSRVLIFASATGSLPVELTSFTAAVHGAAVLLSWKTATEVDNACFAVERTGAGSGVWTTVGSVNGHGTTNAPQTYGYTDRPGAGSFSYRLKQTDRNGKFTYTKEIESIATAPSEFALLQNYPNPFNPSTTISYAVPAKGNVSLEVYDVLGQKVMTLVNDVKDAGSHTALFDAGVLPSGLYFARLTVGTTAATMKMTLMK